MRSKQVRIFAFGVAIKSELTADLIDRFVYDTNAEALAVVCKAIGFDRNSYSAVYLLTRNAHLNHAVSDPLDPVILETTLNFYDNLANDKAEKTVRYWRISKDYWQAVDELAEDRGRVKMFS